MSNIQVPCTYCQNNTTLVDNKEIYGKSYGNGKAYWCKPCDAYVGCHADGRPYGTPANKELRRARNKAHAHFDPFWKQHPHNRSDMYKRLAKFMKVSHEDCHIGMFNIEQCEKVLSFRP